MQLDVSTLAGILAEKLLTKAPWLDKAFFANSGAESVEAAIKFARAATGRAGIVHCDHAFHGLTYGSLAMNGDEIFKKGFGPMLPGVAEVPFDDLAALEQALAKRDIAAFFVEPIQGKGVNIRARAISPAPRRCAANTGRCSSPMKSRPASAARANSSPSSIGTGSSRTW